MSYIIYVDGSYNEKTNQCGYGLVITKNGEILFEESKEIFGEGVSMRNVYGEIVGACRAVELATIYNINDITIAYDYEGIEKWVNGVWKRKNPFTKAYFNYMNISRNLKISFLKIKSHSGDILNDRADELAKKGAGF